MANRQLAAAAPLYQCKSCERDLEAGAFYASNQSKCKECVKASVRENRQANADYYRSYDRMRYRADPKRKDAARKSAATEAGEAARKRYVSRLRTENPEKYIARNAVNNCIRGGRIAKGDACFFCGNEGNLQAHHRDYSKPLDVFWLCPACHGKLHSINGDFHRGGK